jgi:hypothetical protein
MWTYYKDVIRVSYVYGKSKNITGKIYQYKFVREMRKNILILLKYALYFSYNQSNEPLYVLA